MSGHPETFGISCASGISGGGSLENVGVSYDSGNRSHTGGVSVGAWAADTAQQFGSLMSALMGPAIVSAYAFAAWSLAANLGWTDSFIFESGPLSNSFVWFGVAVLVNVASEILRRHTRPEE
jgi:hypothetical protein